MLDLRRLLVVKETPLLYALIAALFLALVSIQLRFILGDIQLRPEEDTVTHAKAFEAQQRHSPYLADAFPGGRQFKTAYGTIQVFEWGPEDGEKVLILHGLCTPCISLGDMAKEFVSKGYRVMIFVQLLTILCIANLFGRGYSDAPNDLPYDARLYTTQILLVLASSPLPWTGSSAFHIVGFSLGGSIAVVFAAYHANMLRSMTLICPGGLIRTSHISRRSRFLYSSPILPNWLRTRLLRSSLEPRNDGAPIADASEEDKLLDVMDFDEVPIAGVRIGDVIRWQLRGNPGFVPSYLSTLRSALVFGRHDRIWRVLGEQLARRRTTNALPPPGLQGGRICLVLADRDVIVVKDEFLEDVQGLLCMENVEVQVLKGGHEVAVSQGKDVASIAIESWNRKL